jgi:hypothetical protein
LRLTGLIELGLKEYLRRATRIVEHR